MVTPWPNNNASAGDPMVAMENGVDDWLPVTSSRKSNWWHSAFHNVNAIVGTGVLSLPFSMSELGWGPGIAMLVISWLVTLYTLWQMVQMHETVPRKRFNRYHELGQHAFGEKLGLYVVIPQQLVVQVSVNIIYTVTAGKSLQTFHELVCRGCKPIELHYFIIVFASVHLVLSQLPNLGAISAVCLAGAIMSVSYSTVSWGASLRQDNQGDVHYGYRQCTRTGTTFFSFANALGTVAFAYGGHSVVLEIQATIPSTPEKRSKERMWKGAVVAYIIVAFCYFPVALVGYWAFGNRVCEDILASLELSMTSRGIVAMANMMVVLHIIGANQLYAMIVFDMMEGFLTQKVGMSPGYILRLISRSTYVAFTMFAAIAFSSATTLVGFLGGLTLAPTTYFLPCVMWLAIYKPRRYGLSWFTNWICITFGLILMIISAMGGLWNVIHRKATTTH